MLLLDHGDSAATGDDYLICGCRAARDVSIYDIDRLGGSNAIWQFFPGSFLT